MKARVLIGLIGAVAAGAVFVLGGPARVAAQFTHVGWHAELISVEPDGCGGHLVEVSVTQDNRLLNWKVFALKGASLGDGTPLEVLNSWGPTYINPPEQFVVRLGTPDGVSSREPQEVLLSSHLVAHQAWCHDGYPQAYPSEALGVGHGSP